MALVIYTTTNFILSHKTCYFYSTLLVGLQFQQNTAICYDSISRHYGALLKQLAVLYARTDLIQILWRNFSFSSYTRSHFALPFNALEFDFQNFVYTQAYRRCILKKWYML